MISNIRLQNFRSYADDSFEFESGVNIIVGPNASGKTNLLEAISLVCSGKSFRSSKDIETVRIGKPWARIDAYASGGDRSLKMVRNDSGLTKEFVIAEKAFKRLSRQHKVPIVVFEPNHLLLLHGSPENRRIFIDDIIQHKEHSYEKLQRDYKKALAQRNRLLKSGRIDSSQMFVWDLRLVEYGEAMFAHRLALIDDIQKRITKLYSRVAGKKYEIDIRYTSSCDLVNYGSSMLRQLESNRTDDYRRGFTSVGPHRDDIWIAIDGKSTSSAASRGEVRTMLLALKIYELELVESIVDKKPILLLDDVFSELDGARRKALTHYLNKYQSFITTTDADILSHRLVELSNTITI